MEKIASFTIDHIKLQPGVYVSRKDKVGDSTVTTFDLRMTSPNEEPVMNTAEMHTIEHLGATFLRNHKDFGDKTVYFGPMGCRTGFYLLLAGDYESKDILPLVVEMYEFVRDFEGEVPGASPKDCGNYLDMNLGMAKYLAAKYLKVLTHIDEFPESRLVYTAKGETIMKKLISWNVNGLRACVGKGFMDFFNEVDADVFCIQESKLQEGQIDLDLPGYHQYWNYAEKKGYSGTAMFTKEEPISVSYGLGIEEHDHEGRVITAEFPEYYIVTCYTPNSKDGLARLDYRMTWEDAFLAYLKKLEEKKPVIFCGDLNVAHKEIDLKNPKTNRKNAGFTDEERGKFTDLLNAGFIDTWRYFYPDTEGIYSWWSYRFKAREKNAGWRIDYFCVSESLKDELESAKIHTEVFGSDHCPVELVIKK